MEIEPGLYEHFKGGRVVVLGVAKHSEAHHMQLVIYRDLDKGDQIWARPADMFVQKIQRGEYKGPRFWRIGTIEEAVEALPKGGNLIEGGSGPVRPPAEEKPEEPRRMHDASTLGQRPS